MSPHAPAYEPEKWNSQRTEQDYEEYFSEHEDLLGPPKGLTDEEIEIFNTFNPPEQRVNALVNMVNTNVMKGATDSDLAETFGISKREAKQLREDSDELYQKQGYEKHANRYSYAINDPDRYRPSGDNPGDRTIKLEGGKERSEEFSTAMENKDFEGYKKALVENVVSDGAIAGGEDAQAKEGYYRVAVYALPPEKQTNPNALPMDMHFVRENPDGTWSHKLGSNPVIDTDSDGNVIEDPKTAHIGEYEFVEYVYVPEGGLDVGFDWEPTTKPGSPEVPEHPNADSFIHHKHPSDDPDLFNHDDDQASIDMNSWSDAIAEFSEESPPAPNTTTPIPPTPPQSKIG